MSSSIAEELMTSEPRLLRDFSPTIHLDAIALRRRAPWWVLPLQALRQPQRPCPTNQKPAVTLDCVFVSSFVHPLALLLSSKQFSQFLLSACSLCGTSIVAPRLKSVSRTSPRRRPLLRALIDAKARLSSRKPASRLIFPATPTGWSRLGSRLSTTNYAPRVSLSRCKPLGRSVHGRAPSRTA